MYSRAFALIGPLTLTLSRAGERGLLSSGYWAVRPPSITSSLPVTNEDSSEAR